MGGLVSTYYCDTDMNYTCKDKKKWYVRCSFCRGEVEMPVVSVAEMRRVVKALGYSFVFSCDIEERLGRFVVLGGRCKKCEQAWAEVKDRVTLGIVASTEEER